MDKIICFIVQYECNYNITIAHTQLDKIYCYVLYISVVPILPIGTLCWLSDLFRIFRFTKVQKDKTKVQLVQLGESRRLRPYVKINCSY